jgi:transcription elongation GreA/GreB family factor
VVFASTVELEDLWSRATPSAYQIVGDDEADIDHGLISVSSPIARADRQVRRRRRGRAGAGRRARIRVISVSYI